MGNRYKARFKCRMCDTVIHKDADDRVNRYISNAISKNAARLASVHQIHNCQDKVFGICDLLGYVEIEDE